MWIMLYRASGGTGGIQMLLSNTAAISIASPCGLAAKGKKKDKKGKKKGK
jgi:hypothetical protein